MDGTSALRQRGERWQRKPAFGRVSELRGEALNTQSVDDAFRSLRLVAPMVRAVAGDIAQNNCSEYRGAKWGLCGL